jgi:O-antigen ligase
MLIHKCIAILLYSSVYLMLVSPQINLSQNMLEWGPVHIYLFEIPLILAYVLSILLLPPARDPAGVATYKIYSLFIPIVLIGFIGSIMYVSAAPQTVIKEIRPAMYWLSGIILTFLGHRHLRLKTLSYVVAAGILTQFFCSFLAVKLGWSIIEHGRLLGRSVWFTPFFVILLATMITYKKNLLAIGKYNITPVVLILIPLLMGVLLCQNRTVWIVLALIAAWWLFFKTAGVNRLKFLFLILVFISVVWQLTQFVPFFGDIKDSLTERFFEGTISSDGMKATWEVNREIIYTNCLSDFKKHPIMGNGFAHEVYFDSSSYREGLEDRSSAYIDNSFLEILVKTGLAGLAFFIMAIYQMYSVMRKALVRMEFSEEWLYLKTMVLAFPFFVLMAFNISTLYGYPEVMIFSLFFAKVSLMESKSNSLCSGNAAIAASQGMSV